MGFDEAILYIQYPGEGNMQCRVRNIYIPPILLHKLVSFTVLRGGQATGDDEHTFSITRSPFMPIFNKKNLCILGCPENTKSLKSHAPQG